MDPEMVLTGRDGRIELWRDEVTVTKPDRHGRAETTRVPRGRAYLDGGTFSGWAVAERDPLGDGGDWRIVGPRISGVRGRQAKALQKLLLDEKPAYQPPPQQPPQFTVVVQQQAPVEPPPVRCSYCNTPNRAHAGRCGHCGAPLGATG